ncbi:tRNA 2-thiocytidine(32) synthetase TtcA [Christensenellaceae bacterium OttesenSCG-928-K19]|nr:tRNA 2-thiocytidine(32) synthetase TtcA [Christensenellaceae bacterium OttesenSCG-928-K19]
MRKILGMLRKADERFHMIENGDNIAVGYSGGKDSSLLLYALTLYRRFSKKEYTLQAICVDLGFESYNTDIICDYVGSLGVPLHIVKTNIAEIVFDIREEKNPCALCSKMRKGALYERAVQEGCNKAAFAHHADDAVETFLMSMMYEARLNTFSPKTYLSRRDITLIRPLVLARENDVQAAVVRQNIPVAKNPCPVDFTTKREQSKEILEYLNQCNPGTVDHIFRAILNSETYNLWDKKF